MIRKGEDRIVERHEHKFGADGFITVTNLTNSNEELNNKGRVFAHTILLPGCGIGYHVHNNESELYYILKGSGEFNDNGTITKVDAGDFTITPSGSGHALKNTGNEPLEIIALILFS